MKALLILAVAAMAIGCTDPDRHDFIIKADSVIPPGAWPGGAPMTVKVYAFVGPDLCWRFKEFKVDRDPLGAKVTIIGTHRAGTCADALSFMSGTELTLAPPLLDPFELRILQPDGTTLSKIVRTE